MKGKNKERKAFAKKREGGAIMIEAAYSVSIIFLFILSFHDLAQLFYLRGVMNKAVHNGYRMASVGSTSFAQLNGTDPIPINNLEQKIENFLTTAQNSLEDVLVTVSYEPEPPLPQAKSAMPPPPLGSGTTLKFEVSARYHGILFTNVPISSIAFGSFLF